MSKTTEEMRHLWQQFECNPASMVVVPFGPDRIRVAPPTAEAWDALAAVMLHHDYHIRTQDTDSYNCRAITGGTGRSLHSFGVALDVNWTTNPFRAHPGETRKVCFSDKPTQDERAKDVRFGIADTDMTPGMIADIEAIKTKAGMQVFEWGGSWQTRKDCMHFELDVSPEEFAKGIDRTTVKGWTESSLGSPTPTVGDRPQTPTLASPTMAEAYVVIARGGLRLRSAASETSSIIRTIPEGTHVFVISREGQWALVDLQGDHRADGYMHAGFLRAIQGPSAAPPPAAADDILAFCTPEAVCKMFPATPKEHVASNLPFVIAGLRSRELTDRPLALMAFATIRAETEGFVPISEGQSHFNTRDTPFDLYERKVGNTQPGDGARFKGRGYVQLTGRANYTRISEQIGSDLVANPELANDPTVAGLILAQFLKNAETRIRGALTNRDLALARKLVNGGSHGLDRFVDAFERGERALPA